MEKNLTEQKKWLLATHASSLVGLLIPFAGLIAPVLIKATKGKENEIIKEHANNCLRFNLCYALIYLCLIYLPLVLVAQAGFVGQYTSMFLPFLTMVISCVVSLSYLFFIALALWNISQDKSYSYPSFVEIFTPNYYVKRLA